jgi:copper oxidase (laccase) domain-containing protein
MIILKTEDAKATVQNRRRFFEKLSLNFEDAVYMNVRDPAAWDLIYDASAADKGAGAHDIESAVVTDALVTNQQNLTIVLVTADCNPVIMYDPVKKVTALVHLGWQSTLANLAAKVITHLQNRYGSDPADLKIHNGPSIRAQSYAFEPPITQADMPGWQPYLVAVDGGKIGIDLTGYNMRQCIEAGVRQNNIEVCPVDTATSANYFSHYRASRQGNSDNEGRFATLCMLR